MYYWGSMLHPASGWWFIGSSNMLYMLVLVTHRLLLLLLQVVHWKNEMLIHNWPFCPSWWPCSMLLSMWLARSTATTTIITTTITTMTIITTTTTWIWTQSWVPKKDPCTYLLELFFYIYTKSYICTIHTKQNLKLNFHHKQ